MTPFRAGMWGICLLSLALYTRIFFMFLHMAPHAHELEEIQEESLAAQVATAPAENQVEAQAEAQAEVQAGAQTVEAQTRAAEARRAGIDKLQSGKASMYYLHVYKSGGTTFCSTARAAGQRTPPDHGNVMNCNLMRGLNDLSPDKQLTKFRAFTVVANEYDGLPVSEAALVPPSRTVYVTTLRDPRDRFISHFHAARAFSRGNQGAFRNLGLLYVPSPPQSPDQAPVRCAFHDCSVASFLSWLAAGWDAEEARASTNGVVVNRQRIIGGKSNTLNLPWTRGDFILRYFVGFDACKPGLCDDSHLAIAKDRLGTLFSVIMFVEDYETGWDQMKRVFGWPHGNQQRRRGTQVNSNAERELGKDRLAFARLEKAVGTRDLALFSFARDLASRQQREGPSSVVV